MHNYTYVHICTWESYHGEPAARTHTHISLYHNSDTMYTLYTKSMHKWLHINWNYERTKGFNQLFQGPGCLKNFDHPGGRETSVLGKLVPLEKGATSEQWMLWETLWFKSGLLFTCFSWAVFLKCFLYPWRSSLELCSVSTGNWNTWADKYFRGRVGRITDPWNQQAESPGIPASFGTWQVPGSARAPAAPEPTLGMDFIVSTLQLLHCLGDGRLNLMGGLLRYWYIYILIIIYTHEKIHFRTLTSFDMFMLKNDTTQF